MWDYLFSTYLDNILYMAYTSIPENAVLEKIDLEPEDLDLLHNEEFERLAEDVVTLNDIYREFAQIVKKQGDELKKLDDAVSVITKDTADSTVLLQQANELQWGIFTNRSFGALVGLTLAVTVVAPVSFVAVKTGLAWYAASAFLL